MDGHAHTWINRSIDNVDRSINLYGPTWIEQSINNVDRSIHRHAHTWIDPSIPYVYIQTHRVGLSIDPQYFILSSECRIIDPHTCKVKRCWLQSPILNERTE